MFLSTAIPLAAIFVSPVWAQLNVARCAAGFDWNRNSLGQDPCTVGSILDASCRGLLEYTYPPLTNSAQHYLPPRANRSGDVMCNCNTVMYSLSMACASCQGGQIYSWMQWMSECPSVYVSQYPANVPQGTTIPRWAYYDVTSLPDQTWNDSVAMSTRRHPKELLKRADPTPSSDPSPVSSPASDPSPPYSIASSYGGVTITRTTTPGAVTSTRTPPGAQGPKDPTSTTNYPGPATPTTSPNPPGPGNPTGTTDSPGNTIPANPNPSGLTVSTGNGNNANSIQPTDPTGNNANSPGPTDPTDSNANSVRPTKPTGSSSSVRHTNSPSSGANPLRPTGPAGSNSNSSRRNVRGGTNLWPIVVVIFLWTLVVV